MFWGYATVMSWIASRLSPRRKIFGEKDQYRSYNGQNINSLQGATENCTNFGRNPKDTLAMQSMFYQLESLKAEREAERSNFSQSLPVQNLSKKTVGTKLYTEQTKAELQQ